MTNVFGLIRSTTYLSTSETAIVLPVLQQPVETSKWTICANFKRPRPMTPGGAAIERPRRIIFTCIGPSLSGLRGIRNI